MSFVGRFASVAALVCAGSLVLLATGCTLRNPSQGNKVRIKFPVATSLKASAALVGDSFSAPTSIEDFGCFAVNVTGAGIASDSSRTSVSTCAGSADYLGILSGLHSIATGEAVVEIPAGPRRKIQLFAVQSRSGACPSLADLFKEEELRAASNVAPAAGFALGKAYLVGEQELDVVEDATVKIQTRFDPAVKRPLFCVVPARTTATGPGTSSVSAGGAQIMKGSGVSATISVTHSAQEMTGQGIRLRVGHVGVH